MIHFKLLSGVVIILMRIVILYRCALSIRQHVSQPRLVHLPLQMHGRPATQPPATVSTADDVKTDTRVATAGADRAVRQVSYEKLCLAVGKCEDGHSSRCRWRKQPMESFRQMSYKRNIILVQFNSLCEPLKSALGM